MNISMTIVSLLEAAKMDEYISREAVLEKAKSSISVPTDNEWDCGYNTAMAEMREFIKQLPSAEVQPIKKSHWYHNTSKYISELDAYFIQACCSCCGKYSDRVDLYSTIMSNKMCSHCGARMDGGAENDT